MKVALLVGMSTLLGHARTAHSQRGAGRDSAMSRAAIDDASHLRRAEAPAPAQEARWKRADWRDPSRHAASFVEANGQRLEWLDWGGPNRGATLVFLPAISIQLLIATIIAWQLGSLAKRDPRAALPMTGALVASSVGMLVLGRLFFLSDARTQSHR